MSGGNVPAQVVQVFRQAGISPAGAAGIVGNWQQESSLNPASPGGFLGQWQGPRLTALQTFAQRQGRSVTDPVVQAQFAVNELRTQYPGLYGMLRTTSDPRAAALAVSQQYERPGDPQNQNRVAYAEAAFKQLVGAAGGARAPGMPAAPAAPGGTVGIPVQQQVFDQAGYQQAQGKFIAGQALQESSGAANPFNSTPGASQGFAQSLGPDSAGLFAKGLLTTSSPDPQSFVSTQTKMLQVAQSALQGLAGGTVLKAHPALQAATAGVTNIAGGFLPKGAVYVQGRKDQGRDGRTNPGGPIVANGNGVVVNVLSDPSGFGPRYPVVHFTSGPYAGRTLYFGHTLSSVSPGQRIQAGQVISHTGTSGVGNATVPGWFEIGFADSGSPGAMGQPAPF